MMKRYTIAVAAIVGLGFSVPGYADNAAVTNKTTETNSVTTTQQDTTQVQQPTELKWTELKGKVERIDLTQNVVQIKEKGTNKLIEVPVTDTIRVMDSSNHALAIGDLKQGQKVILRNESKS